MNTHHDVMLAAALEYAAHNWAVFPLRGKVPAIPNPPGHGVLDATTHPGQITEWWHCYRGANIGVRVPRSMVVLDLDPRNGGLESLAALQHRYGPLPDTLTTLSGRGDGGWHRFYRRPPGKLSAVNLGSGIDIKTSTGYVVSAPSIHPDTGKPYTRIDLPVATPPHWLITLLLPRPPVLRRSTHRRTPRINGSASIADAYSATVSWADVLEPHGWFRSDDYHDGDEDGSVWLHPKHTSKCSATVRNGCLFVWSTSTVFTVSEPGNPKGYTKFRAYALLNHNGDLSAAARSLRGTP